MAIKIKFTGKVVSLSLVAILLSGQCFAQGHDSVFNFKFNHQSNISHVDTTSLSFDTGKPLANTNTSIVNLKQFDATWTYPWETKSMNIDLGLTLRHLSGIRNSSENIDKLHFQQMLPLLHASALYNFSFKGLSAGLEGSRLDSKGTQVFDYKAKISYEWRKGFGLQGGWRHQQFSLDKATDNATNYEFNGAFIDFYLDF